MSESIWLGGDNPGAQWHGESISAQQAEERIREYNRQLEAYHDYMDLLAYRVEKNHRKSQPHTDIYEFPRWWITNVIFLPITGLCTLVEVFLKGKRRR